MTTLIKEIEEQFLKAEPPKFEVGDTVKVKVLIREGKKERAQAFEGTVIAISGSGINKSFSVRKIFQGVGIERTFMLHAPKVESVKVIRKGRTRRSKLYYLRSRIGTKATRLREDIARMAKDSKEKEEQSKKDKAPKAKAKKEETPAEETAAE